MKKEDNAFSLYIHIPYCLHKCNYCNFYSIADSTPAEKEYCQTLLKELAIYAEDPLWQGRKVRTIYFGGGTPSLFSADSIALILNAISKCFDTSFSQELTLEANPGTVTKDKLLGYRDAGINRLSLGAQSFNPDTLKVLGRIHTSDETIQAISWAKEVGFNLSLDLIYAIPNQTLSNLREDLKAIISFKPEHISAYCLSIEPETPLEKLISTGTLQPLDDDISSQMMELVIHTLTCADYRHYETSNFCLEGFHSRHNNAYWDFNDYLGLGAAAHSFNAKNSLFGRRWANITSLNHYINLLNQNTLPLAFSENLTKQDAKEEFFMLKLRKSTGFTIQEYENRFQEDFIHSYSQLIHSFEQNLLITFSNDTIALTEKGFLLADSIIEKFVGAIR